MDYKIGLFGKPFFFGLAIGKEQPVDYADRRAAETGKPYFVSNFGHAMLDRQSNRKAISNIGCEVIFVSKPWARYAD